MIHTLETDLELKTPRDALFPFFADAGNLERLTPPELRFRILTPLPIEMREGARIEYQLSLFGVPFRWRTRITVWEPPVRFVDMQESGPYRLWEHTHTFEDQGETTRAGDVVRYELPLSPLGDVAHPIVRRQLERIFLYRSRVMVDLFGGGPAPGLPDGVRFR